MTTQLRLIIIIIITAIICLAPVIICEMPPTFAESHNGGTATGGALGLGLSFIDEKDTICTAK